MIVIVAARFPADVDEVRALFVAYATSLDFDLAFQDFAAELAALPGAYLPPDGAVFLAREDTGLAVACGAVRRFDGETCEMKRLYVQPAARGLRIGRRLAEATIAHARSAGYRRMCLDTVGSMVEAIALYESLGFSRIAPYRHNPFEDAVYMALIL